MVWFKKTTRRLLVARSVVALFALQMALFVLSMIRDVPYSFDGGIIDGVVLLMIKEARLVNAGIDYLLFSPQYTGDLDLLLGFLALPLVYYITAVVVSVSGQAVYQFGQKRLAR